MSEMRDLLTVFKNKFRKIENLTKKCVNLSGAIKFNKTCLNNRIYPVHVNIYIYICVCVHICLYDYTIILGCVSNLVCVHICLYN